MGKELPKIDLDYLIQNITWGEYRDIFDEYAKRMSKTKYSPEITEVVFQETPGTIGVIIIRNNELGITNDMIRNNDYLIVIENVDEDDATIWAFRVTADPKTRKYGIASIMPQVYFGNIRNHKWLPGRIAICQDKCPVWVYRWGKGEDHGYFGINIHNNAGFLNSSLGCTILADENKYQRAFKPILQRVQKAGKGEHVSVAVMEWKTFAAILGEVRKERWQ